MGSATPADRFFMVCDGVGGALKGELASATACEAFSMYVRGQTVPEPLTDGWLREGLSEVEQQFDALFAEQFLLKGMATTLTLVLFHALGVAVGHVGDSRVYQVRSGQIVFQTADHSLVGNLVRAGELKPEEAASHAQKNVIMRAVQGSHLPAEMEIGHLHDIQAGDYFFLCSDGVWECLPDVELAQCLGNPEWSNEEKARHITSRCEQAARDNYSGYLIQVSDVPTALAVPPHAAQTTAATARLTPAAPLPAPEAISAPEPAHEPVVAVAPNHLEPASPAYAAPNAGATKVRGSGGLPRAAWLGLLAVMGLLGFWGWSQLRSYRPTAASAVAPVRQPVGKPGTGGAAPASQRAPSRAPASITTATRQLAPQPLAPAAERAVADGAVVPATGKRDAISRHLTALEGQNLEKRHLTASDLQRGAAGGDPEAMFLLGRAYEAGALGLPVSLPRARAWFEKGSKAQSSKAKEALNRLLVKAAPAVPLAPEVKAAFASKDPALQTQHTRPTPASKPDTVFPQ